MSSINNVNNNNYVVNVGRTVPLTPGPQDASKSIPVVVSTDQQAVPVEEQNKIQSEVALSLLGIPRSEVALGIFADVNTYDINPTEWSFYPLNYSTVQSTDSGFDNKPQGWGIKHLPEESGALVEAPADEVSVLTSKRFFRYQPGRVSSATFGIKTTTAPGSTISTGGATARTAVRNPTIKKYGIFDNFDGYYWETRDTATGDQFSVVRRTQSLLRYNPLKFGNQLGEQTVDHSLAGKPPAQIIEEPNNFQNATTVIDNSRFSLIDTAFNTAVSTSTGAANTYLTSLSAEDQAKCKRDMDFAIDAYLNDLKWGGDAHTIVNATTYRTAILNSAEGEQFVHTTLRNTIVTLLTDIGETAAASKITTLAAFTIDAVGGVQPDVTSADYGDRQKIDTIFEIYSRYLAYLVSESMTYDTSVTSEEVLKYKCLRDVKFIIDAYAKDCQYGGNASTIYNAKRYYYLANSLSLQVYTQTSGGVVSEISRHQYLKNLLTSSSNVNIVVDGSNTGQTVESVVDLFGLSETLRNKFSDLADIVIANFSNEYYGAIDFGNGSVHGDLVIYRDGLIMTHAAVYDPSLLKKKTRTSAKVDFNNNTLTLGKGDIRIGQFVNYYGDAAGLVDGKTYFVLSVNGTKGNVITLADPMSETFDGLNSTAVDITGIGSSNYIETPVPFIFPDEYEKLFDIGGNRYDGMFPYLYTDTGNLPADTESPGISAIGYIDTAIDPNTNPERLQEQIDSLNLLYTGWVRDNVDPKYWSVYEYRVPRSRFSGDSLDASTRPAVYSDDVSGNRPGQRYLEDGDPVDDVSVWDFDFNKVTMLKIEFSWYGAVGALFLAYVPVGNGEARWVRVHHLRASNQLKISSLGNATLPITYLTYGGGSEKRLGLENILRLQNQYNGSHSEFIVKYGASYYIDGGDRGTVRLYNHSSDVPTEIYGSRYEFTDINNTNANNIVDPYFTINTLPSGFPAISTYYIGARVVTGVSQDQGVQVIWVDGNNLYLNKAVSQVSSINLIVDRPAMIYGLETKRNIVSGDGIEVRNRVQVYPTLMSIGASGTSNAKLTLVKTPLFQTFVETTGTFTVTDEVDILINNQVITGDADYITNNGDFVYGYFQAYVNNSSSFIKVLGRLEKQNNNYFFYPSDVYSGTLVIAANSTFLKEGIFDSEGNVITTDPTAFSKERLSSVLISNKVRTPIPGTGVSVSTYYVAPGAQEHDLSSYFDYNKEYISFPLTDNIETLYVVAYSNQAYSENNSLLSVSTSLTWEEQ